MEIDGDAEPMPGIRIIPTPGHSPGHQSIIVETNEGRVILGGQAFNFSSDYARQRYSLELALRGEAHGPYPDWIKRFQEFDPWRVYFAQDTAIWNRVHDQHGHLGSRLGRGHPFAVDRRRPPF